MGDHQRDPACEVAVVRRWTLPSTVCPGQTHVWELDESGVIWYVQPHPEPPTVAL